MRNPGPEELVSRAREAARNSYSPYSLFPVGAALLCADGTVITGTNVENRSYGLACCAERSAVFSAVSQGKKEFTAVAVCCPRSDVPVAPCGACRQVLGEFCPPETPVFFAGREPSYITSSVGELLPHDSLQDLKKRK
ncbi:MAG TPA: cytidine deaminase [Spirochaetia bacterium]|nr:cytidine deaminase [Spirochaetia bacterium]